MKQENSGSVSSSTTWKVVTQYPSAGEKVYDLAWGALLLEVRVSSQLVAGERNWHVSAQQSKPSESITFSESAETKAKALESVGLAWGERATELGLPALDWSAIAAALLAVRGI
jgi:hypothetical protein